MVTDICVLHFPPLLMRQNNSEHISDQTRVGRVMIASISVKIHWIINNSCQTAFNQILSEKIVIFCGQLHWNSQLSNVSGPLWRQWLSLQLRFEIIIDYAERDSKLFLHLVFAPHHCQSNSGWWQNWAKSAAQKISLYSETCFFCKNIPNTQ